MKWVSTPTVQAQQALYSARPAKQKASRSWDNDPEGLVRAVPPNAPARTQHDQVLEDAGEGLRRRQDLHGLHRVAARWTQIKG